MTVHPKSISNLVQTILGFFKIGSHLHPDLTELLFIKLRTPTTDLPELSNLLHIEGEGLTILWLGVKFLGLLLCDLTTDHVVVVIVGQHLLKKVFLIHRDVPLLDRLPDNPVPPRVNI